MKKFCPNPRKQRVMVVLRYYKTPGVSRGCLERLQQKVKALANNLDSISTEICYFVVTDADLAEENEKKLSWILATPFEESSLTRETILVVPDSSDDSLLVEIGPRLNFSTPFSTNAVSICKSVGMTTINRLEASVRYLIKFSGTKPSSDLEQRLVDCLHDKMTQCRYKTPIETFDLTIKSDPLFDVDIMGEGRAALEKANKDLGLAFDDWDLDYYTKLFKEKIKRNPTSVECFDLAQSNSEHSRHWFFRGKLVIDGEELPNSLFKMVMSTQQHSNNNNIIKFNDNSSGIHGYEVMVYKPSDPTEPSKMVEVAKEMRHIIFTAETHNFPTGVAPFPGATTGTGGRIRDVHCTGRGAHVVAGTAGYSFGNLNIPGYDLPWEDKKFEYPSNFALPLDIAIEASNGASDYGNKFGEPVLAGFTRSFGMVAGGERREYVKPIMFSGGIGQLDGSHIVKETAVKGMEVAKVGGPVYRIGVGGGAASSVEVQGDNKTELDFGAVQRGDAEMEQKLNRLIRACVELGDKNPIASIHDQGAGGNGNVLKEIVEPAGAIIRASDFQLGDPTLSILELWGAEYQESNAILLSRQHLPLLEKIGRRERCPVAYVGTVTGDGRVRLEDFGARPQKRLLESTPTTVAKKAKLLGQENGSVNTVVNGQHINGHINEPCKTSDKLNGTDETNGVDSQTADGHVNGKAAEEDVKQESNDVKDASDDSKAGENETKEDNKGNIDVAEKDQPEGHVETSADTKDGPNPANDVNEESEKENEKPVENESIPQSEALEKEADQHADKTNNQTNDADQQIANGNNVVKVSDKEAKTSAKGDTSAPDDSNLDTEGKETVEANQDEKDTKHDGKECKVNGDVGDSETKESPAEQQANGQTNGHSDSGHVTSNTTNEKGDYKRYPVDLELEHVLGKMPQKVFNMDRKKPELLPLSFPDDLTVRAALDRVLRLPSVASKRYLTNKVDRCVTGLVAQQQCVGPLHTPLADVAVTALSYMEKMGGATAIGEQPIKGLVDTCCGARMSVGEALTNLVFAKVSDLKDVKCSGNWMWPAKLPGEGAALVDACRAMCDVMNQLGVAIDGGKDSLSMAARVGDTTIKAPGTLVVSAYVGCPNIALTVTPDLKCPGDQGQLLYVDISGGKRRLGGTALAQCYNQLGTESPDLDKPEALAAAFNVMQMLIEERKISAGHDISDGGVVTCLLEMAFAGNCGVVVDLPAADDSLATLFTEELGFILEVKKEDVTFVTDAFMTQNVTCSLIGQSSGCGPEAEITIKIGNSTVLEEKMVTLRDLWEETSFELECRQANPNCVKQERDSLRTRQLPQYTLTFDPDVVHIIPKGKTCPKVAVIREEGSNSDREMSAAFMMAGFEVWDVNMQDLASGAITMDMFQGIAFVGGFSYADVLGSAKGWAATALFNPDIKAQFEAFRTRLDTFSLGVCNGCQLMSLLGWVAPATAGDASSSSAGSRQGLFLDHNDSERFECRFVNVKVTQSPAIMLKDMEGTMFGMWAAHGEGKMVFKSEDLYTDMKKKNLLPVHYVTDEGEATVAYPYNPNGSPDGVAALCSEDGRHLAIMPHPERCFLPWQCPWMPTSMTGTIDASPWLKMFQNAFDWSIQELNK